MMFSQCNTCTMGIYIPYDTISRGVWPHRGPFFSFPMFFLLVHALFSLHSLSTIVTVNDIKPLSMYYIIHIPIPCFKLLEPFLYAMTFFHYIIYIVYLYTVNDFKHDA